MHVSRQGASAARGLPPETWHWGPCSAARPGAPVPAGFAGPAIHSGRQASSLQILRGPPQGPASGTDSRYSVRSRSAVGPRWRQARHGGVAHPIAAPPRSAVGPPARASPGSRTREADARARAPRLLGRRRELRGTTRSARRRVACRNCALQPRVRDPMAPRECRRCAPYRPSTRCTSRSGPVAQATSSALLRDSW